MSLPIETARAALARAAWIRGLNLSYDAEAIADLLADIRHWCHSAQIDYDLCERRAASYFLNEIGSAS